MKKIKIRATRQKRKVGGGKKKGGILVLKVTR